MRPLALIIPLLVLQFSATFTVSAETKAPNVLFIAIEGQASYFITDLQWGPVDCGPWDFRDGQSALALKSFFKEAREKPFFAAVGFHAPHIKFAAPRQFFPPLRCGCD